MVVGSNPVDGSIHYSVYTNKKSSHPTSLSCVLAVASTKKKSAAQPKTTRLCSFIRVISLWLEPTLSIWLSKPVCHVRGEVRFWRAGTGHVGRGGQ